MEQPTLFGDPPSPEDKLGPNQRAVLRAIREQGRVDPDEAGAIVHARRGVHPVDARCDWCARDGRAVLASLAKRGFPNGRPRRDDPRSADTGGPQDEIPY